jgi:RNA polymerase sigma-70 factor (ECF subfamily)
MPDAVPGSDEALVASSLRGDDTAFAQIVARHKSRIFAMAARYARGAHELDDIAQEVFLRAHRHLHKFRAEAPFAHWLARVATSTCLDFLRRERRQRDSIPLDSLQNEPRDDGPARVTEAAHARETLLHAMRQLAPKEQLVLTLCELEERSIREVASLTGWSEANVKVRAFRARQNHKKILQLTDEH